MIMPRNKEDINWLKMFGGLSKTRLL